MYFGRHTQALVAEGVGRYLVALFGMQPDEAGLLGFQLGDESALGLTDLDDGLLADSRQRFDGLGALGDILSGELHRTLAVVALYGFFDELRPDAGAHVAGHAPRSADAEKVRVASAALAARETVGQAVAAVAAEDAAAQVVVANLGALPSRVLLIEQGLHPVEGVLIDQGIVATWEDLFVGRAFLVDDPPGVVGIAEDALQGSGADLLGWSLGARPRAQAEPVQLVPELGDRVFASGVELEGEGQEVLALRVGHGDSDLAAIRELVNLVDVAKPSPAVGTAVLSLEVDAAPDVLAGLHRLVLVLGGDDALGKEGGSAVIANHGLAD